MFIHNIRHKRTNSKYDPQFKISIIKDIIDNNLSVREVVIKHFLTTNQNTVSIESTNTFTNHNTYSNQHNTDNIQNTSNGIQQTSNNTDTNNTTRDILSSQGTEHTHTYNVTQSTKTTKQKLAQYQSLVLSWLRKYRCYGYEGLMTDGRSNTPRVRAKKEYDAMIARNKEKLHKQLEELAKIKKSNSGNSGIGGNSGCSSGSDDSGNSSNEIDMYIADSNIHSNTDILCKKGTKHRSTALARSRDKQLIKELKQQIKERDKRIMYLEAKAEYEKKLKALIQKKKEELMKAGKL